MIHSDLFERLFILEAEDEDEAVTGLEAEVGHGRELLAEGATGVLHHQLAPAPRAKVYLVVIVVVTVLLALMLVVNMGLGIVMVGWILCILHVLVLALGELGDSY